MAHGFQPQRVYPRYGRAIETASHVEFGVSALLGLFGRVLMDGQSGRRVEGTLSKSPTVASRVVVCGFPRTGTTFLTSAIGMAQGTPCRCARTHDVLDPAQLCRLGSTAVLTLRDAAQTVASWSLYHRDPLSSQRLRSRLAIFTAWHRLALRAVERMDLAVLHFSAFTQDPAWAVEQVLCAATGQAAHVAIDPVAAAQRVSAQTHQGALALEHRNLPSEDRSALLAPYQELLGDVTLAKPVARANAVVALLSLHAQTRRVHTDA